MYNVNRQQPNLQELLCCHSLSFTKNSAQTNKCRIFKPNVVTIYNSIYSVVRVACSCIFTISQSIRVACSYIFTISQSVRVTCPNIFPISQSVRVTCPNIFPISQSVRVTWPNIFTISQSVRVTWPNIFTISQSVRVTQIMRNIIIKITITRKGSILHIFFCVYVENGV